MKVDVVLEELNESRFRASVSRPFELSVERSTKDESIAALRTLLDEQLTKMQVIELDVGSPEVHPLASIVGSWKDDPGIEEVVQHMRDYRRQVDRKSVV